VCDIFEILLMNESIINAFLGLQTRLWWTIFKHVGWLPCYSGTTYRKIGLGCNMGNRKFIHI